METILVIGGDSEEDIQHVCFHSAIDNGLILSDQISECLFNRFVQTCC
jgi:hypothetical protein